jgi:hypothetical protein
MHGLLIGCGSSAGRDMTLGLSSGILRLRVHLFYQGMQLWQNLPQQVFVLVTNLLSGPRIPFSADFNSSKSSSGV